MKILFGQPCQNLKKEKADENEKTNKMKGFGMDNKGKRNENERNTSAHGLHEMEGGRL